MAMDEYAALVEEFRQGLPARLAGLLAARAELAGPRAAQAWASIDAQVHRLAGAAGAFGFADMTDAARAVEAGAHDEAKLEQLVELLRRHAPGPALDPGSPAAPELDRAVLDELREDVGRVGPGRPGGADGRVG